MSPRIGRNDPCWCGSGNKYKFCHLDRDNESRLPFSAVAAEVRRAGDHRTCFHPLASAKSCGRVISAHTLQRSRVLKAIADDAHHEHIYAAAELVGEAIFELMKAAIEKNSAAKQRAVATFAQNVVAAIVQTHERTREST